VIIQRHILGSLSEEELKRFDREKTMVYAHVKGLVPLMRERLTLDNDDQGQTRYARGKQIPLREKRIFGVLTPD
jgi:hypothetical protein